MGEKWYMVPHQRSQNLVKLLSQFDTFGEDPQAIYKDDFFEHYADVAQSYESEDDFIRLLEQSWGTNEHESDIEFKRKVSATFYRLREAVMMLLTSSSIDPEGGDIAAIVDALYSRIDTNEDGAVSVDEFEGLIAALQLPIDRSMLKSLFARFDPGNTRRISKETFKRFIQDRLN